MICCSFHYRYMLIKEISADDTTILHGGSDRIETIQVIKKSLQRWPEMDILHQLLQQINMLIAKCRQISLGPPT